MFRDSQSCCIRYWLHKRTEVTSLGGHPRRRPNLMPSIHPQGKLNEQLTKHQHWSEYLSLLLILTVERSSEVDATRKRGRVQSCQTSLNVKIHETQSLHLILSVDVGVAENPRGAFLEHHNRKRISTSSLRVRFLSSRRPSVRPSSD
jgi:hypothetical protein